MQIGFSFQNNDPLVFPFAGKYGQVEVGGPYVGAEFHKSRPFPSRISFYYPVANSIDLSKDYWKRDESLPFTVSVKVGTAPARSIGREGWRYELSPHTVTFLSEDSILSYRITYEFCLDQPAMVTTISMKNRSAQTQNVNVLTGLVLALRTCQTYARRDSAYVSVQKESQSVTADFTEADTRSASVFVVNAGERASRMWANADDLNISDDGKITWPSQQDSSASVNSSGRKTRAAAVYEYSHGLKSGEEMVIMQVTGSCAKTETGPKISLSRAQWKSETEKYSAVVRSASAGETHFTLGDRQLDRTAVWAKALLKTNAHYLDGVVVPMPCPAEYNFFFTHDLLMTNLGAVNYDPLRVKRDLLYVASLAKDSIIPHAYYWKDDGFKTEFCTPSNWNHLWFIEVSASYLRHTQDTATIRTLYPLIAKSLREVLTLQQGDLMVAFRPDWWDLGWKEGPRTYITALSMRAIEDYLLIASWIDGKNPALPGLEKNLVNMRSALSSKLWNDSLNYLVNYNGADIDKHFYMGSLIAPAFGTIDRELARKLILTAGKELMAPGLGIRSVMPADFHKDSVIQYFKIAGNEAGDEYTYINGGVWPHNNAWYALGLRAAGKSDDALSFVRQTMTIDGIAASSNGIPALYEYRYSNPSSPRYGEIDKPSFLWAGGFYLYTMYSLAGMNENVWNLSVSAEHSHIDTAYQFSYQFGGLHDVTVRGNGRYLQSLSDGNTILPTSVLPVTLSSTGKISVSFGETGTPYLNKVNAVVHSVASAKNGRSFSCVLSSFKGHAVKLFILCQKLPRNVRVNGAAQNNVRSQALSKNITELEINFTAGPGKDTIVIEW